MTDSKEKLLKTYSLTISSHDHLLNKKIKAYSHRYFYHNEVTYGFQLLDENGEVIYEASSECLVEWKIVSTEKKNQKQKRRRQVSTSNVIQLRKSK